MSDGSLIWSDVRFDHVAAQVAAAECERTARIVRDAIVRRSSLAATALGDGRGPWRDHLVRQIAAVDQRSVDLEQRLRSLAEALRSASIRAGAEQARRAAARQDAPALTLTSATATAPPPNAANLGHLRTVSVRK